MVKEVLNIIEELQMVLDTYLAEKCKFKKESKDNQPRIPAGHFLGLKIRNDIPDILRKIYSEEKYFIKGSIGDANLAYSPWIRISDRTITIQKEVDSSTKVGIYVAILFKTDMTGFYLAINQGWTYFENNYKPIKKAITAVEKTSKVFSDSLVDTKSFVDKIDLKSFKLKNKGKKELKLPRNYERGTICSKYYDGNSLPSNANFLKDIRECVDLLAEISKFIGPDRTLEDVYGEILTQENGFYSDNVAEEVSFQDRINEKKIDDNEFHEKIGTTLTNNRKIKSLDGKTEYRREARTSAYALKKANYQCEMNENHETFITKAKHPFMEGHHLIPFSKQEELNLDVDKSVNIKCLCPTCHRKIHLGTVNDKKKMIKYLYRKSQKELKKFKIDIGIDKLLEIYGISSK
jgi:5-methylcytosine-specific restriction protein A